MCDKAVRREPNTVRHVPDNLKTQEMCGKAFEKNSLSLKYIPNCFKTQGICDPAVRIEPYLLANVPNFFKTQKMCNKAVRDDYFSVWFVPDWFLPDWFVTQQRIKYLRDTNDDWYDNKPIEWYDGYKAQKAEKGQIKKE